MDYGEAIRYLLSFADFERSGRFQDRPDVAPMRTLLSRLGDPHLGRATIHVAGSKGKGSVCAMVDSVLRAQGTRTGLYTSPHLHSYTERVRVDGQPIDRAQFARLTERVREAVEEINPELGGRSLVTFDLLTALAFLAFREADVEVQVIEVGLGGRVDSTNVFERKEVAVITPISLEHTQLLGDTIERIAREKAGIITPGCTAIVGAQAHKDADRVIRRAAEEAGVCVLDVARSYRWDKLSHDARAQAVRIERARGRLKPSATAGGEGRAIEARLPLLGRQQIENAATAVAAIDACGGVSDEAIVRGLEAVRWPGRLEVLRQEPLLIADGAHNRDSARRLREALVEYFDAERVLFIVGCSADKDIGGLAEELGPLAERVLAVRADHPRAMKPERIAEVFRAAGVAAEVVDNVGAAIDLALAKAGKGTVICVTGSLFVAAEAREHLGLGEKERIE